VLLRLPWLHFRDLPRARARHRPSRTLEARIRYDVLTASLAGLALLPEPAPPRPRHIELNLARVARRVAGSFGACQPANTSLSVITTISVAGVRADMIFRRRP